MTRFSSSTRKLAVRIDQRWRRLSTTRSVIEVMAIVLIVHVIASRFISLPPAQGRYEVLVGVAYFVYGLFSAFAIDNSRTRLARINELLKGSDGDLIALHQLAKALGPKQDELRTLLDLHMQDQIDYRLVDFDCSAPSLSRIEEWGSSLDDLSPRQEIALDHMLDCLVSARRSRQQLEALVRQRVTAIEWISLLSLLATLWLLMLASSGGPIIASFLGGALIASLAGTTLVLWNLDSLKWQEGDWIWRPLHSFFRSLGLLPYYNRSDLESGRMTPPPGDVRAVTFPNDYPDLSGKVVEVITIVAGD